ncbi:MULTISPECIES: hemolysin family protein [Paracoccus]|uniref:HlyC/CorC family transporter n=1 Tax=Paracoccus aerius TaxID=1915382 RepID=A0ABS1S980_9RHOB|nr:MULTISPECIES: hemolysin family protein [Paracoccus]MBL3675104.1 HlyC/CorC family transporter [Paracoccus aerius]QIR84380.1 HlyC/CorC family transporter [Paracoccus sp. AK26]GHG30952.1 hemolysin [Paracoccus aerius]
MLLEILIVLLLTMFNGVLAMSELAIVSARPARLKVMAAEGSTGAQTALELGAEPGRFLSSVQIGITLVGVLSGAFSGATLGARLSAALMANGLSPALSQALGVGGVVVLITYLSLIIGELVPKQIALRSPEGVASRISPLILFISRIAAPIVWILDISGRLVLRLLGQSGESDRGISDEEIRVMLSEARSAGVIEPAETEMIAGVMRIADRSARGLMTPRHEVETVDVADPAPEVLQRFRDSRRSRLLVRDGTDDDIIGVITLRELLTEDTTDLRPLVQEVPVIREGLPALSVIEELKASPAHMLLVYDEYGHFEGVVTAMDLLEAIAGDFPEPGDDEPKAVQREDGSWLVAGWMPADEFAEMIGISLPEDRGYESVAGLVLDRAGVLPDVGAHVTLANWRIEVVDLDGRRIDKLLVSQLAEA